MKVLPFPQKTNVIKVDFHKKKVEHTPFESKEDMVKKVFRSLKLVSSSYFIEEKKHLSIVDND